METLSDRTRRGDGKKETTPRNVTHDVNQGVKPMVKAL